MELADQNINNSARGASSQSSEAESVKEQRKFNKFPTAYTILVIIELLFFILTYIISWNSQKVEISS